MIQKRPNLKVTRQNTKHHHVCKQNISNGNNNNTNNKTTIKKDHDDSANNHMKYFSSRYWVQVYNINKLLMELCIGNKVCINLYEIMENYEYSISLTAYYVAK
jgi:hypothetical protein